MFCFNGKLYSNSRAGKFLQCLLDRIVALEDAGTGGGGSSSSSSFTQVWEGFRFMAEGGPTGLGQSPDPYEATGTNTLLLGAAFDSTTDEIAGPFHAHIPRDLSAEDVTFTVKGWATASGEVEWTVDASLNGDVAPVSGTTSGSVSGSSSSLSSQQVVINLTATEGDELIFYLSRTHGSSVSGTDAPGDFIATSLVVKID